MIRDLGEASLRKILEALAADSRKNTGRMESIVGLRATMRRSVADPRSTFGYRERALYAVGLAQPPKRGLSGLMAGRDHRPPRRYV